MPGRGAYWLPGGLPDGSVVAADILDGTITNAKLLNATLQSGKMSIFKSTEQTGNASPQNIAHSLGRTPAKVMIAISDTNSGAAGGITEGAHDGTNCIVTAPTGVKYFVFAW